MLLYHFNFGYPFLDDGTYIECDIHSIEPRDKIAGKHLDDWNTMSSPSERFVERCYYPDVKEVEGCCSISIHNKSLPFYAVLDWDKKNLPFTTIWKMLGIKEYVLGIEPMNCHPEGQQSERERGSLIELEPGEKKTMELKLSFVDC